MYVYYKYSCIEYWNSFSAVSFCFLISNLSDLCKYLAFENERYSETLEQDEEQPEKMKGIFNYGSMRTQFGLKILLKNILL